MTEKEYTDHIVIPLLKHMGFYEVSYNHGVREFGKDILFVEYDRFLMKKYYAAQVKVGNISGGNSSQITDIIEHTVRAFEIDFEDLITKQEVAISDYYIIISGQFKGNAKDILLRDKRLKNYLHRVHFFEGHHIEELRARNYADIKRALASLLLEMERNSRNCKKLLNTIKSMQGFPLLQFYTTAISNVIFLLGGLPEYHSLAKQLEDLHESLEINNNYIHLMPVIAEDDDWAKLQVNIKNIIKDIEKTRKILITSISDTVLTVNGGDH